MFSALYDKAYAVWIGFFVTCLWGGALRVFFIVFDAGNVLVVMFGKYIWN